MSDNHGYIHSKVVVLQPKHMHMFSVTTFAAQMHESLGELVQSVTHENQMWQIAGKNYVEIYWIFVKIYVYTANIALLEDQIQLMQMEFALLRVEETIWAT